MKQRLDFLPMIFVAAVAGIVFLPSLYNGFTTWDDPLHILENPSIKNLEIHTLLSHFIPTIKYMYHPLTMISFAVDWHTGGGNPFPFHLTNVLLHIANVLFVYILFWNLSGSKIISSSVSLLFAIHPMNVETVAWISARKDLLYSFFYLAGTIFYVYYRRARSIPLLVGLLFCFTAGLLSKPTMTVFPITLLLIEWKLNSQRETKNLFVIGFIFLLSIAYGIFTFLLSASDTSVGMAAFSYSLLQRILLAGYALFFYLVKIIFPASLSAVYSYPPLYNVADYLPILGSFVGIVILFIIAAVFSRKDSTIMFGLIWYIIPLSVVLQILPFHNSSLVADRYGYIASIGILFILTHLVYTYLNRFIEGDLFLKTMAKIFFAIVIITYSALAVQRINVWRDGESLFTDVLEKDKTNWLAYGNRASARIEKGNYAGAIEDCNNAIAVNKNDGKLHYNRGNAYSYNNQYEFALADYDTAGMLGVESSSLFYNKGTAYSHLKNPDSALYYYFKALQNNSNFPAAYYSIGYLYLHEFHYPEIAKQYLDTAINLKKGYIQAYYQRGAAYFQLQQYWNAMQDISQSFAQQPNSPGKDSIVMQINKTADSVNTMVKYCTDMINNSVNTQKYYEERSVLLQMLGDSIRAENDRRKKREF